MLAHVRFQSFLRGNPATYVSAVFFILTLVQDRMAHHGTTFFSMSKSWVFRIQSLDSAQPDLPVICQEAEASSQASGLGDSAARRGFSIFRNQVASFILRFMSPIFVDINAYFEAIQPWQICPETLHILLWRLWDLIQRMKNVPNANLVDEDNSNGFSARCNCEIQRCSFLNVLHVQYVHLFCCHGNARSLPAKAQSCTWSTPT